MTWLVIKQDGTVEEREEKITLDALKQAVGGWIELVPRVGIAGDLHGIAAFCDEEGALKMKLPNILASRLLGIVVRGDVALTGVAGSQEVPLRPEQLHTLQGLLRLLT